MYLKKLLRSNFKAPYIRFYTDKPDKEIKKDHYPAMREHKDWDMDNATPSEETVKADLEKERPIEELQKNSVEYLKKKSNK